MNLSTQELINIFNTQFLDMLRNLTRVFPGDADFMFFNTAGPMLLNNDQKAISKLFHNNVAVKYGAQILDKNDEFLLETDFSEYTYDDWSNMLVSKLKNYWRSLSNENKEVVWKYLQILMRLDQKINPMA